MIIIQGMNDNDRSSSDGEHATLTPVTETAAAWFARREAGALSATDASAFEAWLAASPDHRDEYRTIASLYAAPELSAALGDWIPADAAPMPVRNRWPIWTAGAGMAVAASVAVALMLPAIRPSAAPQTVTVAPGLASAPGGTGAAAEYRTRAGEQRTVQLSDGSIVTLNGDTALAIAFDGRHRRLRLERGEAFFDVARDKSRPFSVDAGGRQFVALGTRFNVAYRREAAELAVFEGRVAVVGAAHALPDAAPAGTEVKIPATGVVEISRFTPDERGDWRSGWLQTRGMTLGDLADAVKRRSGTDVVVAPEVADLPVSGRFQIRDADRAMASVAEIHGLSLQHQGVGILVNTMTPQ